MPVKKLIAIISGWKNFHFPSEAIEKLAKSRAVICSQCPHADTNYKFKHWFPEENRIEEITGTACALCGCPLSSKIRQTLQDCPEGKWKSNPKTNILMQKLNFYTECEAQAQAINTVIQTVKTSDFSEETKETVIDLGSEIIENIFHLMDLAGEGLGEIIDEREYDDVKGLGRGVNLPNLQGKGAYAHFCAEIVAKVADYYQKPQPKIIDPQTIKSWEPSESFNEVRDDVKGLCAELIVAIAESTYKPEESVSENNQDGDSEVKGDLTENTSIEETSETASEPVAETTSIEETQPNPPSGEPEVKGPFLEHPTDEDF